MRALNQKPGCQDSGSNPKTQKATPRLRKGTPSPYEGTESGAKQPGPRKGTPSSSLVCCTLTPSLLLPIAMQGLLQPSEPNDLQPPPPRGLPRSLQNPHGIKRRIREKCSDWRMGQQGNDQLHKVPELRDHEKTAVTDQWSPCIDHLPKD